MILIYRYFLRHDYLIQVLAVRIINNEYVGQQFDSSEFRSEFRVSRLDDLITWTKKYVAKTENGRSRIAQNNKIIIQ